MFLSPLHILYRKVHPFLQCGKHLDLKYMHNVLGTDSQPGAEHIKKSTSLGVGIAKLTSGFNLY